MKIKESCLDEKQIKKLILKNYKIKVDKLEKINMGLMSSCYKVISCNEFYFFKEILNSATRRRIEEEAALLKLLKSKSMPVALFLKTMNDDCCFKHEDRFICMQEFIEGKSYENFRLPDKFLFMAAEQLGKLDACLKDEKLKKRKHISVKRCTSYSTLKKIKQIHNLSKKIDKLNLDLETSKQIKKILRYLMIIQPKVKRYGKYTQYITYRSSHGDYHSSNLLCRENKINAIIDFNSSCYLPAVWNIIRFYTMSAKDCKNIEEMDIQKFATFVKEYMKYAELTEHDLKYMPYIYIHHLGRKKIMVLFKRYLASRKIGNEKVAKTLLTKISTYMGVLQHLIKNRRKISRELTKLKV